jgi:chromosome segregation ATPase
MCKKVLIATLAVVFGLAVVKGTWIGSHLRFNFKRAQTWVNDRVPPEQEIARLRMELDNLGKDDEKYYDKVARQVTDVKAMERKVAGLRRDLSAREASIRDMRTALSRDKDNELVTFNGSRYERTDLQEQIRRDGQNFLADEATLKSKEQHLQAMRKALAINKKKLGDLKIVREQMATELQKLETALAEERQAQAQAAATLDDADYQRIRKDMDAIHNKIEFLKTKRELKGEAVNGPVKAIEKQREEEAKLDKAIEARFGAKKEVAADK